MLSVWIGAAELKRLLQRPPQKAPDAQGSWKCSRHQESPQVALLRLFGPSGSWIANDSCLKTTQVSFLPSSCAAQEAGVPVTAEVCGTVLPAPCRGHVLVLPSSPASEGLGRAGHVLTARVSAGWAGAPQGIPWGAGCPRFLPVTSPVGLTLSTDRVRRCRNLSVPRCLLVFNARDSPRRCHGPGGRRASAAAPQPRPPLGRYRPLAAAAGGGRRGRAGAAARNFPPARGSGLRSGERGAEPACGGLCPAEHRPPSARRRGNPFWTAELKKKKKPVQKILGLNFFLLSGCSPPRFPPLLPPRPSPPNLLPKRRGGKERLRSATPKHGGGWRWEPSSPKHPAPLTSPEPEGVGVGKGGRGESMGGRGQPVLPPALVRCRWDWQSLFE